MCGIAGILGGPDPEARREAVRRMIASQRHRGPDDEGLVDVETGGLPLTLGFDRLAVLDPSRDAAQPIGDPTSGSWLVFNGEIYDFRALRPQLAAHGHRFRSSGDSEVLLAALVAWGPEALRRLRGMYAFAFWDAPRRRLLLGRDPFGVKPLLYGRVGDAVVFASELRAIRAARLGRLTLDPEAVEGHLAYGAVPEPHTMVREIRALPPGHVAEVSADDGRVRLERITGLADALALPEGDERRPFTDVVAETRSTLADAVRAHLVSDVPVGILLSGGVDSAIVANLVGAARPAVAPTFLTVGFGVGERSEVPEAAAMAARLGGRHEVVPVTADDALALLPEFLGAMDQPTADGMNTYVVARAAAARGCTVLLSGIGGDELFGGYTTFRKAPLLAAHGPWLARLGRLAARLGVAAASPLGKLAGAGRVRALRDAYLLQRGLGWDSPEVARPHGGLSDAAWSTLDVPEGLSPFRAVSFLELSFYLRNQLLRDADVMSSATSVELRVPFLDRAVLATAWSAPGSAHVGRVGAQKRVLRAVLAELRPDRPVRGPKRGFVLPWIAWLRGPLGERVAATLGERERLDALGLPPDLGVRTLAAWRQSGAAGGWLRPWALFTLLEWQRRHGVEAAA